ncbi:MAG: glycerophosphodiester phosphodiesterase family protein [Desulfobacterales bacterium]|jgi:glycerophosphoryl diester phosphodiesterase|nr:glycerophosphodiester phosphodiesterase family protein [Desulfobacterales bacterium]MDD3082736.1 glycerophosphodiester phosphodiesterase family protein [Desulfobacterales bacterium]MDD3951135.1 glycerophosphodiester phosphodiesterase family protein [Desulfobacterales bacterium]
MIRLQAHRGASRDYPENTIVAYEGALKENYHIIELDPKFTKDHECVLLHDYTVNRTGRTKDGEKLPDKTDIRTLTLDEVRELDFGVWFAPEFAGVKIPLFTEMLEFAIKNKAAIKVDNVAEDFSPEDRDKMFSLVHEYHAEEYVGFTCKSLEYAALVAENFPDSELHYDGPVSRGILDKLKASLKNNALTIWLPSDKKSWLPYPPADKETVEMAREYGKVGLWTAVDEDSLRRCLALNPDAMELDGKITPDMVN